MWFYKKCGTFWRGKVENWWMIGFNFRLLNSRQCGIMRVCDLVGDNFILQNEKFYYVIYPLKFRYDYCAKEVALNHCEFCHNSLWFYWDNNSQSHCGQCEDEEHFQILDLVQNPGRGLCSWKNWFLFWNF